MNFDSKSLMRYSVFRCKIVDLLEENSSGYSDPIMHIAGLEQIMRAKWENCLKIEYLIMYLSSIIFKVGIKILS